MGRYGKGSRKFKKKGCRFDFTQRDGFRKGVAGVMAQIFDNSDDERMISGQHVTGIVENFALTPFLYSKELRHTHTGVA